MKKLLVFIILLVLAGCSSGEPSFNPVNYRVGAEGIVMQFSNNAPPATLRTGEEFTISLNVENRGATTSGAVINLFFDRFYISRSDDYFQGGSSIYTSINELTGRSEFFPQGERTLKNIGRFRVSNNIGERAEPTTTIRANICYPYETFFSTTTCIKTDYYSEERDTCQVRTTTHRSQGAPIAVTRVQPEMIPRGLGTYAGTQTFYNSGLFYIFNEIINLPTEEQLQLLVPQFEIEIRNLGSGDVFLGLGNTNNLHSCEPSLFDQRQQGLVAIEAFLGEAKLDCGSNTLRFEGSVASTTCTLGVGTSLENFRPGPSYDELITIHLKYLYVDSIQRDIRIRR